MCVLAEEILDNVKTQQEPNKKNYIGYFKAVYSRSGLLSLQLAGYMLVVTQCQVACGNILNEQTSFNPLPGKAEIEHHSSFENL